MKTETKQEISHNRSMTQTGINQDQIRTKVNKIMVKPGQKTGLMFAKTSDESYC